VKAKGGLKSSKPPLGGLGVKKRVKIKIWEIEEKKAYK
jgi:hypothetical protein